MNSLNWKNIFISGVIFAVLIVTLLVGVYLVKKPQSQSVTSKAATTSCIQKWPADPNTECGKSTQSPKQGEINVSLTPGFHWDYGGYPSGSCTSSSGCNTYYANIYLWKGSMVDSNLIAVCGRGTSNTIIKDAPFSCFKTQNGNGPLLTTLEPGTTYWWRPAPGGDNLVHAEQDWNYTFTTGAAVTPPPSVATCQRVIVSKDLSTIKIGDTVTFTGYGNMTNPPAGDAIDKINFIILKDGVSVSNTEVNTILESAGVWKATKDFTVTSAGSYSVRIRVHWLSKNSWLE